MRRLIGSAAAILIACAFAAAPAIQQQQPEPAVTLPDAVPVAETLPVAPVVMGPAELIGPRMPKRVNPDRRHPIGDLIEVDHARQRLTFWSTGRKEFSFPISTGMPGWETPLGRFRVYAKVTQGWSRQWKVVLPYMLPFHGNYTFHELPYYPGSGYRIGASSLGSPASHGCVRVNLGDAKRLFDRTSVGTPVWIHA